VNSRLSWSGTDSGGLGDGLGLDPLLCLLDVGVALGAIAVVVVVGKVMDNTEK
jgi:hypothetical protein